MRKNLYTKRAGYRSHGKSGTAEFRAWWKMLVRCYEPSHASFHNYGARGVRVAKAWRGPKGFAAFLAHVGPRPSPKHSLDRWPNNAGNYKPGNVRWATRVEQNQNTSKNVTVTFNGETHCISEWARRTGINKETIRNRINQGWSARDTLTVTPSKKNRRH